jgi:hypothetical protein
MNRNYTVSPSMIDAQSGVLWSYDNAKEIKTFSKTNALNVRAEQCHNLTICLWYVSPLQSLNDSAGTQYALLGKWNKWTAVSQQRFTSIITDTIKNEATIIVQGAANETVQVVIFHSVLLSVTVNCSISVTNGQTHLVITPSNVIYS